MINSSLLKVWNCLKQDNTGYLVRHQSLWIFFWNFCSYLTYWKLPLILINYCHSFNQFIISPHSPVHWRIWQTTPCLCHSLHCTALQNEPSLPGQSPPCENTVQKFIVDLIYRLCEKTVFSHCFCVPKKILDWCYNFSIWQRKEYLWTL